MYDGYQGAGEAQNFTLNVPEQDMSGALMILKMLQVTGRISDYKRREAQAQYDRLDCVNIYGYTLPPEEYNIPGPAPEPEVQVRTDSEDKRYPSEE